MSKPLKLHRSIDQQIKLLESRNLKISNKKQARQALERINYYRLTGYLFDARIPGTEQYQDGETFTKTLKRYECDEKLNRLLMYALWDIEVTFKARFSYTLSSAFPEDPLIYLNKKIYKQNDELATFRKRFKRTIEKNAKIPFVAHHIEEYGGDFPVWVAVEIMTMGNLNALYKNLQTCYQKQIAKKYNTGVNELNSWITNMRMTRNHIAHGMRLYKYNFSRIPASCNKHPINATYKGFLFDQVAVMSIMYSDSKDWNEYVLPEFEKIFSEYRNYLSPTDFGFPKNWKKCLTKLN